MKGSNYQSDIVVCTYASSTNREFPELRKPVLLLANPQDQAQCLAYNDLSLIMCWIACLLNFRFVF